MIVFFNDRVLLAGSLTCESLILLKDNTGSLQSCNHVNLVESLRLKKHLEKRFDGTTVEGCVPF